MPNCLHHPRPRLYRLFNGVFTWSICGLSIMLLGGCGAVTASFTSDFADGLTQAVLDNDDLSTVESGLPAYLLMVDGMVRSDPDNEKLLRTAASLHMAYAESFVSEPQRALRMSDKALDYSFRAVCLRRDLICQTRQKRFRYFEEALAATDQKDVANLYTLGTAWAGWIQIHRAEMDAVAELPHVEAILQRVVQLDETYENGSAHIYLGVLAILVPPALGGQPETARRHFERAIDLSEGQNLMGKVVYAERYARMMFDRPLHDRLLKEVLAADPRVPGLTLANTYAQKRARELLDSADDYF